MKQLYDNDVLGAKDTKQQVLANHRAKMQALMVTTAAQSPPSESAARWAANDWMTSQPSPLNNAVAGGRRRAHMTDPPTIIGAAAEQKPKTAQSLPRRGILKKPSAGTSSMKISTTQTFPVHFSVET